MPRLPEIREKNQLPEKDRDVFDYLMETRGHLSNGFSVLLNSPVLADRIARTGTYIRFESVLPAEIRELAALTTSCETGNRYELLIHTRTCRDLKIAPSTIDAVVNKASIDDAGLEESIPICAARELIRNHALSEVTFEAGRKLLGDRGILDLVATIGYFSMIAILHVSMEVRLPNETQSRNRP